MTAPDVLRPCTGGGVSPCIRCFIHPADNAYIRIGTGREYGRFGKCYRAIGVAVVYRRRRQSGAGVFTINRCGKAASDDRWIFVLDFEVAYGRIARNQVAHAELIVLIDAGISKSRARYPYASDQHLCDERAARAVLRNKEIGYRRRIRTSDRRKRRIYLVMNRNRTLRMDAGGKCKNSGEEQEGQKESGNRFSHDFRFENEEQQALNASNVNHVNNIRPLSKPYLAGGATAATRWYTANT